jgi:UDP-2,3-diacylglucosamine hydrolase
MPHTLFISDLHLSPDTPEATAALLRFLRETAPAADTLYVLGDLFEYWIGDEGLAQPFAQQVARAFLALVNGGVPVYFMHGNRDFLIGERFAVASGMKLLTDPAVVTV